jgi:SAM-dependent methyltransferase
MSDLQTSEYLRENYETYYRDDSETEWRRLGAIDKASTVVELCHVFAHRTILEIGAGDGAILQRLSELGFGDVLHAVEISESGVEAINRRSIAKLVDCRRFDGYHLPYGPDEFDLAVLSHVIEHVEHPRQLICEASRVARFLFVEVPLEDMNRRARDFVFDRVGHINFYSPRTIRWLLQSCGLRVIRQITTNSSSETYIYQYGPRGRISYHVKKALLRLAPSLATQFFTYHESLLCEKMSSTGLDIDEGQR